MTNDEAGRVACGAVIGGLAAVALTKPELHIQSSVYRWIVYCVATGIVVNAQAGMPFRRLVLAGFCSAAALVIAVLWMVALGRGSGSAIWLSFVKLNLDGSHSVIADWIAAAPQLTGVLALSTFGVAICGLARPIVLKLIRDVMEVPLDKAQKIEALLKVGASIAGALAMFFV